MLTKFTKTVQFSQLRLDFFGIRYQVSFISKGPAFNTRLNTEEELDIS